MKDLKTQVTERLIAKGNNPKDVKEMVDLHYEYAVKKYTSIKAICECIRAIY